MNIGLVYFILVSLVLTICSLLKLCLALKRLECRHRYHLSGQYVLDENGCLIQGNTYVCSLCGKETTKLK